MRDVWPPPNDHLWPPGRVAGRLMYPSETEFPRMRYRGWCPVCFAWWDMRGHYAVRCPSHPQYWLEVREKARRVRLLPDAAAQLTLEVRDA